jgi:uncharacterized membrane protein
MGLRHAFGRDERGTVAILSAVSLTMVIGAGALAVDIGSVYLDRRAAQAATDLAAMSAAADLTKAGANARATITQNRFPADTPFTLELGTYTPDAAVAAADRFRVSTAATANAARVTLRTQTNLYFGRILTGADSYPITTVATAARSALAAFAIGSRLASVDGGLLNRILGSMLGGSLSLSVMDYRALADVKLDMFDLMNAVATRARITGTTYDSLLSSDLKIGDVFAAMTDAARTAGAGSTAINALGAITRALGNASSTITGRTLVDAGPYNALGLGQKPAVSAALSALDILAATVQAANGQHQIAADLNLAIPGILGAKLLLTIGERPVGTSWVTVGSEGASVHTAQTRILLTVNVAGNGSIVAINLPIYIEIAAGTAKLDTLACAAADVRNSSAALAVTPGVVDAWIANVSASDMTNFRTAPNPGPAALVDTPALGITGRAHATIANTAPQRVSFTYAEIAAQTKKTVNTTSFASSLTSRLLGDLTMSVRLGPLNLGIPQLLTQSVGALLGNVATPVDTILANVLATLGVGLGQADVWMLGIRCDGAVLVN